MVEDVTFFSDGTRIAGELFHPAAGTELAPPIVVCHGFGGIKKFFVGDIARALAAIGHPALTFDYRGFGESDGTRNRLRPLEQVDDTIAAIDFLAARTGTDTVAVYGTSFGGGVAVTAAIRSSKATAAVFAAGIADGERWLRSLRRYWEWMEFQERLEADRLDGVLTGKSEIVDPNDVMVRDPESAENERQVLQKVPERAFKMDLASARAIVNFRPVRSLCEGNVPPLMFIGIRNDSLTPYSETVDFFDASPEPKQLLTLEGISHHEMYQPQYLSGVLESVSAFLRRHGARP